MRSAGGPPGLPNSPVPTPLRNGKQPHGPPARAGQTTQCMVLTLEENPPELLAPLDDPSLQGREWCVALTRSRSEKKLAWYLAHRRIPYFLPMLETRTISRNAVRNPLFKQILFLSFSPHDGSLEEAKNSRCIATYWFTRNQPRLRQELALIASETCQSRSLRTEPRSLRTGDAVRVVSGSMEGLLGRVARMPDGTLRIYVHLQLLGVPCSMEVSPDLCKLLEAV